MGLCALYWVLFSFHLVIFLFVIRLQVILCGFRAAKYLLKDMVAPAPSGPVCPSFPEGMGPFDLEWISMDDSSIQRDQGVAPANTPGAAPANTPGAGGPAATTQAGGGSGTGCY